MKGARRCKPAEGLLHSFDPFLENSGLVPKNEELVNYLSNHHLYTRPIQVRETAS
ncbi:hypothetical protein M378DRAFT_173246 [Amanita muscaria Koide BX008]|uniref:Uncharacterized protein n=1 Tax=Amanita muscaria (strain Koide BX008) TaxID=946122 RepID=A0A0C2WGR9_AMAMK|nr:hypothetical protein M378DRAFT_173246 [Amanita muscaria Koide BX008]